MTPGRDLLTVTKSDDLATAAQLMATQDVHQLPVVENGRLLGLVTRADIVRLIQIHGELSAVGRPEPVTRSNEQPKVGRGRPYPVRVLGSGSKTLKRGDGSP